MTAASKALDDTGEVLVDVMGAAAHRGLMNRHEQMSKGLIVSKGGVTREMALIFPKSSSKIIMEWYLKLVLGLHELVKMQDVLKDRAEEMACFIDQYPGPGAYRQRPRLETERWKPTGST